jgi:hypothetical protein
VHAELARAWRVSYGERATARAIARLLDKPFQDRVIHLFARFAFRGIYFPQMKAVEWARMVFANRRTVLRVAIEARSVYRRWRLAEGSLTSPVPTAPADG